MGTKAEETAPGAKGCLAKAHDDEPIFILRSRDQLAHHVLQYWIELARLYSCPPEKVAEAQRLLDQMKVWAHRHGGAKLPD